MIFSRPAAWRALLQVLPDEVVETLGRADVETFHRLLGEQVADVGVMTVQESRVVDAGEPADENGVFVSARDAAEMTAMTSHWIRGALPPRGAGKAAELEALGRAYRSGGHVSASDVGTRALPPGLAGQRSLHDPINVPAAASILRVSERRVRQLADRLGGRDDVGGAWLFERADVEAFAREREGLRDGSDLSTGEARG